MLVDTDAEIVRLRAVLRDLVALSTVPATWIGREPPAVAAGLADALVGVLQLDFAFVRLCDPVGSDAVDVVRGDGWTGVPEWLEPRLARRSRLSGNEIVPDIGGRDGQRHGVVIPVGVNAEGGVLAAACARPDFPTEFDQLLLSLAGNYAATAFRSAQLIHERTRAEEQLRAARTELELKVAERTAELQRSEGYLAEAQRLAHTGSFALSVPSGEPTHSSDEHSRLYGFEPRHGVPSLDQFLQRIHPDDRAGCVEALERGIREAAGFEMEYRIALPRGPLRYIRARAHPVLTESGELQEFVGTVMDVTERKRAEEERRTQLWFFESMDRINRAIQGAGDLERMLGDVLDVALATFRCDRAWLMYPCDPGVASHRVRIERTRPEYIGAFGLGEEIPNDPEVAGVFRRVLASSGPVRFDPESGYSLPSAPAERFGVRSMIAMAVYPKVDKPYMFGMHQCSHRRIWTAPEQRLFQEIGRRLADALDMQLMFRDLREAHQLVQTSRDELRALAEQQAALRRVATLVAKGIQPDGVFTAVSQELARLVSIDCASVLRYEGDGTATVNAWWSRPDVDLVKVGTRVRLEDFKGEGVTELVLRTGRPARMDTYANAGNPLGARARELGVRCSAGAPIVVDGQLWGVTVAASIRNDSLPVEVESTIAGFTELLGTAISMANSRDELTASRARIVAAADETRRRLERDLHDGVQQRLVSLGLELRAAEAGLPPQAEVRERLRHAASGLAGAVEDLVEISRGIHPAILGAGGLGPALRTLARRSGVPAELDLRSGERRLPERIEVAVYYVVSEALTNAAKHAQASVVLIDVDADDSIVRLTIQDDGVGGADPRRGSGLIGLIDRVEALGGRIEVSSPPGGGTSLLVRIPIQDDDALL